MTSELNPIQTAASPRVLILDDQIELADFLAQMLGLIGYSAVAESNAQRALELIEDEAFDVVISDFKMPEMNGYDFFQAAVAARPELAARFVFLTGDLFNAQTQEILDSTGVPFIAKPFRLPNVQEVLEHLLSPTTVRC